MKKAPVVIGLTVSALAVSGLAALALMAGSADVFGLRVPSGTAVTAPAWSEIKWPFLMDQWGVGKAFVCQPADCGVRIEVMVRPKIGFCNCSTGIADDNELERVADTDLISAGVRPLGSGSTVKVGWMYGLSRLYAISEGEPDERLLSIAFNDECDAVVAVAKLGKADPAAAVPAVLAFLKSTPMVLWTKKELGLEFVRRDWQPETSEPAALRWSGAMRRD
jgi:hypothetical protein